MESPRETEKERSGFIVPAAAAHARHSNERRARDALVLPFSRTRVKRVVITLTRTQWLPIQHLTLFRVS